MSDAISKQTNKRQYSTDNAALIKTKRGIRALAVVLVASLFFGVAAAAEQASGVAAALKEWQTTTENREGSQKLDELIAEALKNNPEIAAARAMVKMDEAMIPQAKALPDPSFGVEQMMVPWGSLNPTQADQTEFSLSHMFPYPGKLGLKGRIAQKNVEVTQEMLAEKELEVAYRVKAAYYDVYMADRDIEITKQHVEIMKNFIEIAQTQYSVGMGSQQDAIKAQVELSKLLNSLIDLGQKRESAVAMLNTALSRPVSSPIEVAPDVEPREVAFSLEELEGLGVGSRPELRAASRAIEKNGLSLSLARKERKPDFMVRYTRQLDRSEMGVDTWGVMLEANLPWAHPKKYRAMADEASARIERSRSDYDAMKLMLLFDLKDRYVSLKSLGRQIEVYRTSILPQAEQALEANLTGYQTGKVDFLMLLDSQRMLLDFQMEQYDLIARHQIVRSEIERIVGKAI